MSQEINSIFFSFSLRLWLFSVFLTPIDTQMSFVVTTPGRLFNYLEPDFIHTVGLVPRSSTRME